MKFFLVDFKIFPNPANEILHLSLENSDHVSVLVYDVNGVLMIKLDQVSKDSDIEIGHFAEGVYLVKVTAESGSFVTRSFVKI